MAGLTPDQIKTLLAGTRSKGLYVEKLNEFIASGSNGVCANEEWVEFEDKKATTLKQGFDNAKENKQAADGAEHVKVISSNEQVYLINMSVAAEEQPDLVAEAS